MKETDPEEASKKRIAALKRKEEEKKETHQLEKQNSILSTRNLSELTKAPSEIGAATNKKLSKKIANSLSARSQHEINVMSKSKVAAETLGSTQLSGCPGDFCGVKVNIDRALEGVSKDNSHLSEFRRKLLEQEGEEIYSSTNKRGRLKSKKKKKKKTEEGGGAAGDVEAGEPKSTVPLKSIVQARHERHLVDIMLRRHANRETGPYCEAISDMSMGEAFPGHFYKHTMVCNNCYRVYR